MTQVTFTKQHPIAMWEVGMEFEDPFIIESVTRRQRKSGEPYVVLELADRTGRTEGTIWDDLEYFDQRGYKRDQYVLVKGSVTEYNGKLKATIRFMRPLSAEQVRPEDFVPISPRPVHELEELFRHRIAMVEDSEFSNLLNLLFHPKGDIWRDFRMAPSARMVHQAYIHGLIEHTINVTDNALALASAPHNAPLIHRDLLITGALVHDIGKIVEYRWLPRIDYTETGLLLGHISIGAFLVGEAARLLNIESGRLAHLIHLILSHHGRLEYGSPRTPATAEAMILHYADYADAQLAVYDELAQEARNKGEQVSAYSSFIERRVLLPTAASKGDAFGNRYLNNLAELITADQQET